MRVEVHDDALTIEGSGGTSARGEAAGFFGSERSYGSFFRQIPLPEGIDSTSATATFKDGTLDVTMPAPPKPAKGRNVPIEET